MSGLLFMGDFDGREIRILGTADTPEWAAQDVCDALGIKSARSSMRDFEEDEKGVQIMHTPGGDQEILTVTEAGLYRLVFRSNKASAKRFRRWVLHEVLPAIRKTGTYSVAGMVMVRQDAWNENLQVIEGLSEAYELQAAAATKMASLAASLLAARRHSKPKDDPRQKLLRFGPLGDTPRIAGGDA